jgi:Family of unknown function (DUF5317)
MMLGRNGQGVLFTRQTRCSGVVYADLDNRATKEHMRELLIPIEIKNSGELVVPGAQKPNGCKHEDADTSHDEPFPESAVDLAANSRTWAFWSLLRLVKETHVWLVWIPLLLLILGIGMNFLAVTMNHGIMPVVLPSCGTIAEKDRMHVAATANSRLLLLCDWIQLHATGNVASPGDYLITAGNFLKWPLVWMWVGFSSSQFTWRKLVRSSANA